MVYDYFESTSHYICMENLFYRKVTMKNLDILKKPSIGLHFLIGIGGLAGGFGAVSNPNAPMGASTELLKNGPFENFLIPGIFLLLVIGLGNLITGTLVLKQHVLWPYFSGAMGAILISWIVIQCLVLSAIAVLHVIFFILGAILGLIAIAILYNNKQFPFSKKSV